MYKTFQEWLDLERQRTLTDNEVVRLLEDWKEERTQNPAPHSKDRIAEWRDKIQHFEIATSGNTLYDYVPWLEADKILDEWEADKVYLLAVIKDASDKLAAARARYEEMAF
jgi:hypothetical protein